MGMLDEMSVGLRLKTGEWGKGLKRATGMLADFGRRVASAITQIAKYGAALGAVAAGGLSYMIAKQTEVIDQTALMSARLGIATERFSALGYAAGLTGVETENFGDALKDLSEKIADAAANGGSYDETLTRIGLSAKELARLPIDEQFLRLSDAIAGLATQGDKAFVAMELMSDEGFRLVNIMDKGRAGIERLADEARQLGAVITTDAADAARSFNMEWQRLLSRINAIAQRVTARFLPVIEHVIRKIQEWIDSFGDVDRVAGKIFGTLRSIILDIAGLLDRLVNDNKSLFAGLVDLINPVIAGFQSMGATALDVFAAISNGLGRTISAITALARRFGMTKETLTAFETAELDRFTARMKQAQKLSVDLGMARGQGGTESQVEQNRIKAIAATMSEFADSPRFQGVLDGVTSNREAVNRLVDFLDRERDFYQSNIDKLLDPGSKLTGVSSMLSSMADQIRGSDMQLQPILQEAFDVGEAEQTGETWAGRFMKGLEKRINSTREMFSMDTVKALFPIEGAMLRMTESGDVRQSVAKAFTILGQAMINPLGTAFSEAMKTAAMAGEEALTPFQRQIIQQPERMLSQTFARSIDLTREAIPGMTGRGTDERANRMLVTVEAVNEKLTQILRIEQNRSRRRD